MKRRSYMRRSSSPMPRGGIRRKARTPSEFARIYGSKKRVAMVKGMACCARYLVGPTCSRGPSENAHTETGGMGYKAGYETIVPLCATHHDCYDEHRAPFADEANRERMKASARALNAMWLAAHPESKDAA